MSKGKSLVHLKTEKENQGQLEKEGQKEFLDTKYKRANEFCVHVKERECTNQDKVERESE